MFTKVSRKGTKMVDKTLGRSLWGVNVDIFPVDGCPSGQAHQSEINRRIARLARICPRYRVVTKQKFYWFCKYLVKRTVFFYPHPVIHLKNTIDDLSKCDPATAPFAGLLMEAKGRLRVDSSVFGSYVALPFENKSFYAVRDFKVVLETLYGDYMTPPPPEKRVSLHQFDVFSIVDKQ